MMTPGDSRYIKKHTEKTFKELNIKGVNMKPTKKRPAKRKPLHGFKNELIARLMNLKYRLNDAYNLSKERYDKGITTLESVLSSQRQYNSIQSQYLQLQRQAIENRLLLILAMGGDFDFAVEGSN